jgi:emp24/gp25L/p24 family/GOLD
MEYLRGREQKLRDTNESTNERVKWFAFGTMGMLVGLGAWQIVYLRAYFRWVLIFFRTLQSLCLRPFPFLCCADFCETQIEALDLAKQIDITEYVAQCGFRLQSAFPDDHVQTLPGMPSNISQLQFFRLQK